MGRVLPSGKVFGEAVALPQIGFAKKEPFGGRLQEVRLATAIRPHNTCQPIRDEQVSGVHKAFEAVEPEFGKAQVRPFW